MAVKLVFDTEACMEDYLEDNWDHDWMVWPVLPDGCEWQPPGPDDAVSRQVRVRGASESGRGDAPVDMVATRWFRTPEMPEGEYLARCVMLIELKNDVLSHSHVDQVLRYFEGYSAVDQGDDSEPDLLCCSLVGTSIRPDLMRIARSIPFLAVYSWALCGRDIWLARASEDLIANRPRRVEPEKTNVVDLNSARDPIELLASLPAEDLIQRGKELAANLKACGPDDFKKVEDFLVEKDAILRARRIQVNKAKAREY